MPKKLSAEIAEDALELNVPYEQAARASEQLQEKMKEEVEAAHFAKVNIVKEHVIDELLTQGQKKYGKGRLYRAGERVEINTPRISSGLVDLDAIIGGGLPLGKIVEIFGEESTGKSSLMFHVMKQVPQTLYIDSEHTLDEDRLEELGLVDGENIFIARPETAEATLELIWTWAKAGMGLIVLDSLMAMTPKAVLENENFEKADSMALIPRLLSQKLPLINDACAKSGTMLVIINQMRSKVGMVFGNPLDSPGGRALKHFASLRIQTGKKGVIDDDKVGEIGVWTMMRVVKSKVSKPHGKALYPFIYNTGFVNTNEVPDIIDLEREAQGFKKKRKRLTTDEIDDALRSEEDDVA